MSYAQRATEKVREPMPDYAADYAALSIGGNVTPGDHHVLAARSMVYHTSHHVYPLHHVCMVCRIE